MFYRVFLRHSELKNLKFSRSLLLAIKKDLKKPNFRRRKHGEQVLGQVSNDKCARKLQGGTTGIPTLWAPPPGKGKIKTQKIFALATLAVLFHYSTFSIENQAQTGDYGR